MVREPVHDRYNHAGRRDLICRWRSVNWRQSHGRWLPPFSPPLVPCARFSVARSPRLTFSSLVFNATRKEFFLLSSGQVWNAAQRPLFRNPGEAVGFCPCHLSRSPREPPSILYSDHRPRSAVIFLAPRPARRANLASRNFSRLPPYFRAPPMDLYGNDSIPNYSLILHVSSFVFQKTHFFVPIQLLSNYLQRDFSIPLNERRACVESHGTNVISLRYRGRKGWNEWRRQRFGNARRHAREITGRFTRELLAWK